VDEASERHLPGARFTLKKNCRGPVTREPVELSQYSTIRGAGKANVGLRGVRRAGLAARLSRLGGGHGLVGSLRL